MALWTADLETNVNPDDPHPWAYSLCEIGNPDNFIYGDSLDGLMEWCENQEDNPVLYFHNLAFDGEFISYWLKQHGFNYIEDKKERDTATYTALLGDMGQFYSMEIFFKVYKSKSKSKGKSTVKVKKVTLRDSLKIINASVSQIAKDFGLPISKLKIDYKEYRPYGHILTDEEIAYIRNDVEIMARALDIMFNQGLNKLTIASDALTYFKQTLCENDKQKPDLQFRKYFPKLTIEVDGSIRKSYKGGFTYLNPIYASKKVGSGLVFDINSAYPAVMRYKMLPFGMPVYFDGEYVQDNIYPLYVQTLSCAFKLKKGKIPSIQLKNNVSFMPNEYITDSKGDIVTLCLTSVDLQLFKDNYDIWFVTYEGGWKFMQKQGFFDEYIDHWIGEKIQGKKEHNKSKTKVAKLMLNSLYGRFGLSPVSRRRHIDFSNDIFRTYLSEKEEREPVYIPLATFITSYGRDYIIRTSQAIRDYSLNKYGFDAYIYSDTDSIHCLLSEDDLDELSKIITIDKYQLGAWDMEATFKEARFVRQKCYIEMQNEIDENGNEKIYKKVTIAGMRETLAKYVNLDNIDGFTTIGMNIPEDEQKLRPMHVIGGTVLVPTPFTVKTN